MKVLVTGGAGFIASHIVDRLVQDGNDVCIVDNLYTGSINNVNKHATFFNVDIRDDKLAEIFKQQRPDIVIHHAAQIHVPTSLQKPEFDADVNILGTLNILKCCIDYNVKKIIYSSSAAVYGEPEYLAIDEQHPTKPESFYGLSKLASEQYIQMFSKVHGLKYTILRYANVYGIRQDPKGEGGVVSIFVDRLLNSKTACIYGDGLQSRDFIYVKDIVQANICAIDNADNEIVNIGTAKQTSIIQLYDIMSKISDSSIRPIFCKKREGDIRHSYFNIQKAGKVLNWQPIYKLEQGLKETIEYYASKFN